MYEIVYENIQEKNEYEEIIKKVLDVCFKNEEINMDKYYINITLTTPEFIKQINNQYRFIDKETDVLSFPMYEKDEINVMINSDADEMYEEYILGDIIISIDRVIEQSKEYGHSFERELAYMIVHGFYHLLGYDHIEEEEKKEMRIKEENILNIIDLKR